MKRRVVEVLIILTMLLGVAGCKKNSNNEVPTSTPAVSDSGTVTNSDDNKSDTSDNGTENDSSVSTGDTNIPDETEVTDVTDVDDGIERPEFVQLLTKDKNFYGTYDNQNYEYQTITSAMEIRLSEEDSAKYPKLASTLNKFSNNQLKSAEDEKEYLQSSLDEYLSENIVNDDPEIYVVPTPWYSYTELMPVRTDSSVVSFLVYNSSYTGGVHGYYGVSSVNIDTETGKEIGLNDVICPEKFDYLAAYIKERLELNSPDEGYWYDTSDVVMSMLNRTINFTIDYDGITFYWNPYEVASYASGIVQYKVLFTEKHEIFTGKYMTTPKNYMVPVNSIYYCNDLDNDGYADYIFASTSIEDDYGDYKSVRIGCSKQDSGEALNYKILKDDRIYGYMSDAYFVKSGNEKYIYFFFTQDSDDDGLQIYKYTSNGFEKIGEQLGYSLASTRVYYGDGDYDYDFYNTFYSPDNMILNTRHDVFGTTFEHASYKVGDDGMPKSKTEFLDMNGYWTTLLQDIEVNKTTADSTETGELTVIPAGTSVKFYRTDGLGRVDLITDDGTCFAMNFEQRNYFNGIYVSDLFDYVIFAD